MSVENKVYIPKADELSNEKKLSAPGTNCATSQVSSEAKLNQNSSSPDPEDDLKERVLKMVKIIKKEFNCNHEADLDAKSLSVIYNREQEHKKIDEFLKQTISGGKSGLMYLCGHPGTGKTSSLNACLSKLKNEGEHQFKPLLFNAMAIPDVKCFGIQLYERLYEAYYNEPCKRRIDRQKIDDDDLADLLEKLLLKISKDPSMPHKVIVIDEVD